MDSFEKSLFVDGMKHGFHVYDTTIVKEFIQTNIYFDINLYYWLLPLAAINRDTDVITVLLTAITPQSSSVVSQALIIAMKNAAIFGNLDCLKILVDFGHTAITNRVASDLTEYDEELHIFRMYPRL